MDHVLKERLPSWFPIQTRTGKGQVVSAHAPAMALLSNGHQLVVHVNLVT